MLESKSLWAEKQVLVTGAGGFIGSHLVQWLVRAGANVRAFVRYNSRGDSGLLRLLDADDQRAVELISGDLRDVDAVYQAVAGCETVFHLGAVISIPYSYLHPVETTSSNITGTLHVLLACREYDVRRLVHTSTSEVYGTALRVPIDESHPLQGQSPYSASKIGADMLAESFYSTYDLPVVTVRPFNTYGPHQSARAVIPTIITQALMQDVIRLGSLEPRRDFTYVTDTVRGFLLAAQAESSSVLGEVFNLGTGKDVSIGTLVAMIQDLVGRDLPVETDIQRIRPAKSEVGRLISDNGRAREFLGWRPTYDLGAGLQETVAWIRDNLPHYRVGRYEI
ncbi:MAG: NAD-dependent epimerase/dehydratase family protein [Chloroflexi bacterium]|jgi:dTDP-glucose 4,6-dehydratase|nr:NAD-dependent epimerase/dehydratase family protein [Chloroflexota bacterium]